MSWLRVSSRLLANTPSDVVWCLPTILFVYLLFCSFWSSQSGSDPISIKLEGDPLTLRIAR